MIKVGYKDTSLRLLRPTAKVEPSCKEPFTLTHATASDRTQRHLHGVPPPPPPPPPPLPSQSPSPHPWRHGSSLASRSPSICRALFLDDDEEARGQAAGRGQREGDGGGGGDAKMSRCDPNDYHAIPRTIGGKVASVFLVFIPTAAMITMAITWFYLSRQVNSLYIQSVRRPVSVYVFVSVCLSLCPSVCPSPLVRLCVRLSVRLSIRLFVKSLSLTTYQSTKHSTY